MVIDFGHSNIAIRASSGTCAATNADRFMNLNNSGFLVPHDRSGRAANHANRINALHACFDNLQAVMRQSLTDETWIAVMGIPACLDAVITSRAAMQVNDHGLTSVVQPALNNEFK